MYGDKQLSVNVQEMSDAVAFKMRNGNESFASSKKLGNNDSSVETSQSLGHGLVLALFFF